MEKMTLKQLLNTEKLPYILVQNPLDMELKVNAKNNYSKYLCKALFTWVAKSTLYHITSLIFVVSYWVNLAKTLIYFYRYVLSEKRTLTSKCVFHGISMSIWSKKLKAYICSSKIIH